MARAKKRGFAAMDDSKQKAIARKGGKVSGKKRGKKGIVDTAEDFMSF